VPEDRQELMRTAATLVNHGEQAPAFQLGA
jgi:hypothetical protein